MKTRTRKTKDPGWASWAFGDTTRTGYFDWAAGTADNAPHEQQGAAIMEQHTTQDPHFARDLLSTPSATTPIVCHRCASIDLPDLRPGSGPHWAAARCRHCKVFIRWISRYSPKEQQARRQEARLQAMTAKPPSQLQLAFLQALGDNGPQPVNMAEASERIDSLKRGRVA
jgi:hypothetical protein